MNDEIKLIKSETTGQNTPAAAEGDGQQSALASVLPANGTDVAVCACVSAVLQIPGLYGEQHLSISRAAFHIWDRLTSRDWHVIAAIEGHPLLIDIQYTVETWEKWRIVLNQTYPWALAIYCVPATLLSNQDLFVLLTVNGELGIGYQSAIIPATCHEQVRLPLQEFLQAYQFAPLIPSDEKQGKEPLWQRGRASRLLDTRRISTQERQMLAGLTYAQPTDLQA